MTQENKDLLLKDLCARLPYHTNLYSEYAYDNWAILTPTVYTHTANCSPDEIRIKPYLFPLSSMTEEQKKDLLTHIVGKNNIKYFQVTSKGCIDNIDAKEQELKKFHLHWVNFNCKTASAYIDWLNKNHFDFRDLIPMGLAIDATGLNIY